MELLVMSGAGNDFVVLDAREQQLDFEVLSKELCKKFGTDGLLALDVSETADFKLHFYNPDGSRGEMCGNGARCICKYAFDKGLAGEAMTVETDAGLVYGWRLGENRYKVQLNNPGMVDLQCHPNAAYIELGDPGIPHSVTELKSLDWADKALLRPVFLEIREFPGFPKGVNVNLYRQLSDTSVRILTYERGVEDFTLACGTGSASVAVALYLQGRLPGGRLTVENPGGTLEIALEGDGKSVTALYLEGPAETIAQHSI
ncbi:MAG: diaminopimelate epimerase [Oscillospiraceae bacterium]|nr:diaminopimelate epimerase [Oscillospiraceae bacterium]